MSDRPHLSNEQELCDYFSNYGQSNESLTTTSSTSSPVNSMVQNNFGGINWHTQSAMTTFDFALNRPQYEHYSQPRPMWSSPQPQQHHSILHPQQHVQLQQQLLHQQHRQNQQSMPYRSPPIMQGSSYQDSYQQYPTDYNELMRYRVPHLVSDVNQHILHNTESINGHQQCKSNTYGSPITDIPTNTYYTPQHIPPKKIWSASDENESSINKSNNNVKTKSKNLKIIEASPSSKSAIKIKTPSPKSTPLPSPLISPAKRKRAFADSRRSSISITNSAQKRQQQDERRGAKRSHQQDEAEIEEGASNVFKEGDFKRKAVDQIENELAFLRDECATILIMLDSLRNAFITDVSTSSNTTSKSSLVPLTGTINFMENDTTFVHNHSDQIISMKNKPRRSIVMAQNPEMEREMRIAYDDLMLQVRQLEKKVERLEIKSRNACILENLEVKRRKTEDVDDEEQRQSQISNTSNNSNSSSCASEDEYEISENEIDDCKLVKKVSSRKGQSK